MKIQFEKLFIDSMNSHKAMKMLYRASLVKQQLYKSIGLNILEDDEIMDTWVTDCMIMVKRNNH